MEEVLSWWLLLVFKYEIGAGDIGEKKQCAFPRTYTFKGFTGGTVLST